MAEEDRKSRLAAMAARAGRSKNEEGTNDTQEVADDSNGNKERVVKFRNYAPKDESLDKEAGEPASKKMRQNDEIEQQEEKHSELERALMEANVDAAMATEDAGFTATQESGIHFIAAPKKVNWDLKRDVAKKMNRLERRTQKAVVELLRLRLEQEAENEVEDNDLD
jgi:coiled-coil domain-containing protein 12